MTNDDIREGGNYRMYPIKVTSAGTVKICKDHEAAQWRIERKDGEPGDGEWIASLALKEHALWMFDELSDGVV